jgi:NADPH-dependent ferric siderophore reductase
MSTPDGASGPTPSRLRREPPTFRDLVVRRVEPRGPRLTRVTLGGPDLAGFTLDLPAASVRLLLPDPSTGPLVRPIWNGNEFLAPDGSRPIIRTLTPRALRPEVDELDVEVVRHGDGPASRWAADAPVGSPVALSGPGRGFAVDPGWRDLVLVGDESAIPAISQLLEVMATVAPACQIRVQLEAEDPVAEVALPVHPGATATWAIRDGAQAFGDTLVTAVAGWALSSDTVVWAAGEAAAMQRLRRHLFDERSMPRSRTTVRGYWKVGRGGDDGGGAVA